MFLPPKIHPILRLPRFLAATSLVTLMLRIMTSFGVSPTLTFLRVSQCFRFRNLQHRPYLQTPKVDVWFTDLVLHLRFHPAA